MTAAFRNPIAVEPCLYDPPEPGAPTIVRKARREFAESYHPPELPPRMSKSVYRAIAPPEGSDWYMEAWSPSDGTNPTVVLWVRTVEAEE